MLKTETQYMQANIMSKQLQKMCSTQFRTILTKRVTLK